MEISEPAKLCDIFADYIISYAKNLGNDSMGKTMIMNLAKAMTCLRGNSVVSYMEGKNDFSKHCKCFSVIDEKGRELYGLI